MMMHQTKTKGTFIAKPRQSLRKFTWVLVFSLIIGILAFALDVPKSLASSAGIKLPFTAASGSWYVSGGYNQGDHATTKGMKYALDFASSTAAGATIVAPASGTIVDRFPCFGQTGYGIAIKLDNRDI